jgi:GntR family transcriptional regulator
MNQDRPVYLRLRDEIAALILEGVYREGEALPSVRTFAAETSVNPLTVAKAYQTFQDEGLVVVRRGVGMFLAEGATERLRVSERALFLRQYWPRLRKMMQLLDIDAADLLAHEDAENMLPHGELEAARPAH